jgi:Skp family chaperone for outer membrane proteins
MRAWYLLGAALVLVFAFQGFGSRAPEKPAVQPHVGFVNLAYVLKYWKKANEFNTEAQGIYKPFQEKEKSLQKRREKVQNELKDLPVSAEAERRKLTEEHVELTMAIEKNSREAKYAITEQTNKQMLILDAELSNAMRRYAEKHHLEAVLSYADAYTEEDLKNPILIQRKLQMSPCMPWYITPGGDISREIVMELAGAAKADKKEGSNPKESEDR